MSKRTTEWMLILTSIVFCGVIELSQDPQNPEIISSVAVLLSIGGIAVSFVLGTKSYSRPLYIACGAIIGLPIALQFASHFQPPSLYLASVFWASYIAVFTITGRLSRENRHDHSG